MVAPMPLVDIGANLTHPAFRIDLDEVLARARRAGGAPIVVTGTSGEAGRAAAGQAAIPAVARRAPPLLRNPEIASTAKGGRALLHRLPRGAARRARPRALRRHHRLDLRRAARPAAPGPGARDPARAAAPRDRRALSHAARPAPAAQGAAQRAGVPAAHRRGRGARARPAGGGKRPP